MRNNLTAATLVAAMLALAPAAGLAQTAAANGGNPAAGASGASQLPEHPGYVGGYVVTTTKWVADMNEQQLTDLLKADGYTDIKGVTLNSGTFTVGSAMLNGKKIENLKIDATNGKILSSG